MNYRDFIVEVFNKPYPWRWSKRLPKHFRATFTTSDGEKYNVYFDVVGMTVEIVFLASGSSDITGSGDQFRVFATVMDIIADYVKSQEPPYLEFTAKEVSRKSLYDAMVKRFARSMGYELVATKDLPDAHRKYVLKAEDALAPDPDDDLEDYL